MAKVLLVQENLIFEDRKRRRDMLAIMSAMLSHAIKGTRKTELMARAGLSTLQTDTYIRVLTKAELLEVNCSTRPIYHTTRKGQVFVDTFNALIGLLEGKKGITGRNAQEDLWVI